MPFRGSPVVLSWLAEAGLSAYASGFESFSPDDFKALLMQDYGKHGVTDMDSKQRLFRLIKRVSSDDASNLPSKRANASPAPDAKGLLGNAGLLDLESHDSSLLSEVRQTAVQTSSAPPGWAFLQGKTTGSAAGAVFCSSKSWPSSCGRPCASWPQWPQPASCLICCRIC